MFSRSAVLSIGNSYVSFYTFVKNFGSLRSQLYVIPRKDASTKLLIDFLLDFLICRLSMFLSIKATPLESSFELQMN